MKELKIKTESLPARCEICHQADCFSPQFNHCSRCAEMGNLNAALMLVPHPDLDAFGRSNLLAQVELDAQRTRQEEQRRKDEQRDRLNRPSPLNLQRAITGSAIGFFSTLSVASLVAAFLLFQAYLHHYNEYNEYSYFYGSLDMFTIRFFTTLLIGTGLGLIGGLLVGMLKWLGDLIRHKRAIFNSMPVVINIENQLEKWLRKATI